MITCQWYQLKYNNKNQNDKRAITNAVFERNEEKKYENNNNYA